MIVCHCRAVSDRTIRNAVREGASCRTTVARHCEAGGGCGRCGPAIEEIIASEKDREVASSFGTLELAPSS